MSSWSERRTGPRVEFRKDVRVIWSGQMGGVVAQAVNLSPTGILLDAPTPAPCPVGAGVLCDVALPNGSRLLRGRVAHTRLLAPAKVGMGIEFVDLSPRVVSELRDVVGESDEQAQRVRVRFEGSRQTVSARALRTEGGFQLVTLLPFFRVGAEVDITLSPDAAAGAKGQVVAIALDRPAADGTPRLLIDVRVAEPTSPREPGGPAVPGDGTVVEAFPTGALEGELELGEQAALEPAGIPTPRERDRTEIVRFDTLRPSRNWRRTAVLAGSAAVTVVALAVVAGRLSAPGRHGRVSPSVAVSPPAAPAVSAAPPATSPAVAAPSPELMPVVVPEPPPEPAAEPAELIVGLVGSLAGATRYPLHQPDGVAFNLPHARATMRIGTYRPDIPGVRAVWVRRLPGGGTHLRFFYSEDAPAPEVELRPDGVHVLAR